MTPNTQPLQDTPTAKVRRVFLYSGLAAAACTAGRLPDNHGTGILAGTPDTVAGRVARRGRFRLAGRAIGGEETPPTHMLLGGPLDEADSLGL